LSGGALYYYVIDEYRVSNELLTEDIYVSSPSTLSSLHEQGSKRHKGKANTDHSGVTTGTPIRRLTHRRLCQGSRGKGAQVNQSTNTHPYAPNLRCSVFPRYPRYALATPLDAVSLPPTLCPFPPASSASPFPRTHTHARNKATTVSHTLLFLFLSCCSGYALFLYNHIQISLQMTKDSSIPTGPVKKRAVQYIETRKKGYSVVESRDVSAVFALLARVYMLGGNSFLCFCASVICFSPACW
jgi:hypothetical protein